MHGAAFSLSIGLQLLKGYWEGPSSRIVCM